MTKFGEILQVARSAKRITLKKASKDLQIKKEHLEALENEDWQSLPEPTFVKGFISSYAKYLGLDVDNALALYRREYDESKYPKSANREDTKRKRRFYLTPARLINLAILATIVTFIAYLALQYSSILASPKLEIISPKNDETVTVPVVLIEGETETDATVSIEGEFVPVLPDGNFSYQYNLEEGRNTIEIIASKRLAPKTKKELTIRLTP